MDVKPLVLDPRMLARLELLNAPGQSDLVEELIVDYLQKTPNAIAFIQELATRQDWKKLQTEAHGLKSGSAALGLNQIAAALAKIELEAERTQSAHSDVAVLPQLFDIASAALTRYLDARQKAQANPR